MNNLTILPSKIQGKGVFTTKPYKKGETVISWEPCNVKLSYKEISNLPEQLKQYLNENKLLTSPNRYLNHSCQANTTPKDGFNIALRDIEINEEITTNYLREDLSPLTMRCNCNRPGCKNIIKNF
jgi:hypothetical protein